MKLASDSERMTSCTRVFKLLSCIITSVTESHHFDGAPDSASALGRQNYAALTPTPFFWLIWFKIHILTISCGSESRRGIGASSFGSGYATRQIQ
jgi:hypothetical protein